MGKGNAWKKGMVISQICFPCLWDLYYTLTTASTHQLLTSVEKHPSSKENQAIERDIFQRLELQGSEMPYMSLLKV